MRLHIVAVGRPAPQGSKERGSAGQLLEQSAYLPAWRQAVKAAAYGEYLRLGIAPAALPVFDRLTPVTIEMCTFFVGTEQCRTEGTDEPLAPPDVDKLLRAVLDALGGAKPWHKTARLYRDDSQVTKIKNINKQRTAPGKPSGAYIVVSDGRE